jgi:hypothetical protein
MYWDKPKEYWDSLESKESLYNEFEKKNSSDLLVTDPNLPIYYKDGEFKAVADSVKDSVEKLLAVLPDVCQHFAEGVDEIIKNKAVTIVNDLDLDTSYGMAVCAWVLYLILDTSNEKSFVKRLESGNGIVEYRAACKAYARYMAFKEKDKERMLAFMQTPEYKMQAMELKLGLRDAIEVPED